MKKYISIITLVMFVFVSGCATIMQGTTQGVGISSTPTGADVTVDNIEKGKTPIVVELKRKDNHFVKIKMDGYLPYETTFTRSTSGWVWGNLAFGGLIGLAVDAISGGIYKLTPTEINAVLQANNQSSLSKDGVLYVTVVLEPDPTWQKIGQLERIN
ncbi:MAG: PEGA domain-containing protein [Candidatus Omnitrophota bacterium]